MSNFFFTAVLLALAPDADVLTNLLESWTVNEKREYGI